VNSKPTQQRKNEVGGLGLANIKRRLALLFADNYALDITETDTTYTVHLKLAV
jgi:hypothetical protein